MFSLRTRSTDDGFALVAVIWTLGLITLFGMAVMMGARYRTRVASAYASTVASETAAESAINLAIATALAGTAEPGVKFPLRCRMPGGERVLVTVEEETGKIDLNTATPAVLAHFFTALTRDQSIGTRLAERIRQFHNPKTKDANAKPENSPAEPRFSTIMELDQIEGISPDLFRVALRLVTVRSGRPQPDMEAASPAMRRLLNFKREQTSSARGLPTGGSVTIRADVRSADGGRFIREALVSLADAGRPFTIREWRRGDIDATAVTSPRDGTQASERSCFRTVNAAGS
jgi:general secretion pathway protein K